MIGKLLICKDYKQRIRNNHNKHKYIISKILRRDEYLPLGLKTFYNNGIRTKSISRIKNRCLLSGRSKAVLNRFRLSRFMFKKLAGFGFLNGIKKGSW